MAVIAKQRYKLDIAPKGGWVIVYTSQHDDGAREIEFEITNQGRAFSIPASINVSVQGIKSNGSYFSHSCSYSGNIVTMALADDMTDIIGKSICVLKFTNSSQQKLATAKFVLNVDTDSSSEGIIIDTEAEEIFNQMLNDIRAQAASISADIAELQSMVGTPLVASTASGMTDHNKIYVYVGSESGYTNGNWYYWNGSAWASGGVYNAVAFETDKTLSVENMPADAKETGLRTSETYTEDTLNWRFVNGYILANNRLSADPTSPNDEIVSELISVRYGFKYKFTISHTESIPAQMWIAVLEYGSDYNPVGSRISRQPAITVTEYNWDYTVSNLNAKYIRVSYRSFGGLVSFKAYRNVCNDSFTHWNKLDLVTSNFRQFFKYNFQIGSAALSNGSMVVQSYKYRITSKGWITIDKPCVIYTNSDFMIYKYYKLPGEDTIRSESWKHQHVINEAGTTIWLTIKRTQENTAEVLNDVDVFLDYISFSDGIKSIGKDLFGFFDDVDSMQASINYFENSKYYNHFLALPGHDGYIDYNSVENTIKIPRDTIIIGYMANSNGNCYRIINLNQDVVFENVIAAEYGSSVLKLSIKPDTETFTLKRYSIQQEDGEYLVAVIRIKNADYVPNMASFSAWSINGKPYNIDVPLVNLLASPSALINSINHRGWNWVAPENTLPAFKLSSKNGFKYVETDVSYTSDNIPVLLHDNTINRTARNADGTELQQDIEINSITYEQALTYDFGIWKNQSYAGTKIPTLDEFCSLCKKLGLHPYIELKTYGSSANNVRDVVKIAYKNGLRGNCTFISFTLSLLEYVKAFDQSARLGLLIGNVDISQTAIQNAQSLKTEKNEVFIDASLNYITDSGIELCIDANIPLEVYGGNATNVLTMDDYITGVTTDNVVAGFEIYNHNID